MKNKIYLLAFLILFQSCYSYKTFDIKNFEYKTPNKLKVNLKNSKKYKGKVLTYEKDELRLKMLDEVIVIPYADIIKIKERERSNLKTELLIRGLGTIVICAIFYLSLKQI